MRAAYHFIRAFSEDSSAAPEVTVSRYVYTQQRRRVVFHTRYVMGRILDGHLKYHYNGFQSEMEPGRLYIFRPNSVLVDLTADKPCELEYYHFNLQAVQWILAGLGALGQSLEGYHSVPLDSELEECLSDLSGALQFRPADTMLKTEILMNLLDLLVERIEQKALESFRQAPYEKLMTVKNSMNDAESVPAQFGASVEEIRSAMIAEQARTMLEQGFSVSDVAQTVMSDDMAKLDHIFRQSWLLAPEIYRALALGR